MIPALGNGELKEVERVVTPGAWAAGAVHYKIGECERDIPGRGHSMWRP